MTTAQFFEKFDLFAGAPDAIPRLRELILQMAVRGNLTSPSATESVAPQKAALEKFLGNVEPRSVEQSFDVPSEWAWIALGDSMKMINGKAFKPEDWSQIGTPIIRIQNLNNPNASFNHCEKEVEQRFHVKSGDLLISWSGTPGTSFGAFIWERGNAYLNQHIFRCILAPGVFGKEFLRLAINARLDEMISHAQGAVGLRHITKGKLEGIAIPLPPLAEQKRIVAKVDELMALCDQLETQQQERETKHAALAQATLSRFAEAATPTNLNLLFHSSFSIQPSDLRKTILTLAVQGKLVPQDPSDEPAEALLVKIRAEKQQIARARRKRSTEDGKIVSESDQPFLVPKNWQWTRLSEITRLIHYGYTASAKPDISKVRLLRITDIQDNKVHWPSVPGCEIAKEDVPQYQLAAGDILVARTGGTVGKTYLVTDIPVVAVFASYLIRIQGASALHDRYLKLFLESPIYWKQLEQGARGAAQPNVNGQTLGGMVVSLPPLAEQKRIVAKVEELMTLVDVLEAQQAAADQAATHLLDAVVSELAAAA
jgi:type I restriction enzyme S subunit